MNSSFPLLQLLARLPAGVWVRIALGLVGFAVLAFFGLAILAGAAGMLAIVLLGYKLRAAVERMFRRPHAPPPHRLAVRVRDADYVIVERRDRV